ncbi:MAG: arginase family protein [Patescibacteria group bacterium]
MNLYATSPTKNFHGMYLRPFLDNFDIPKIDSLIPSKISLANTLFIGDVDLDIEERMCFDKEKLRNINRDEVLKDTKRVIDEVKSFISKFQFIHINFDVDVFNNKEVLATGIPSAKGFMFYELLPLIEIVSWHPNLSLDLSEVNPNKEGRDKTIKIAQKVLSTFLSI